MNIQKMYLTPNKYSRPQIALKKINGIVVHYVGNANSTAVANRNYFDSQKTKGNYVSSHYIIGLDGEIIQCIPENEIAYCSNSRNSDTISIECCHPSADGKFNDKTLNSLKLLLKDLIKRYDLKEDDIIRHFDVTGKMCPLYYVRNESEWFELRKELFQEDDPVTEEEFLVNGRKVKLKRILHNSRNYLELGDLKKIGIGSSWDNKNKIASINF